MLGVTVFYTLARAVRGGRTVATDQPYETGVVISWPIRSRQPAGSGVASREGFHEVLYDEFASTVRDSANWRTSELVWVAVDLEVLPVK